MVKEGVRGARLRMGMETGMELVVRGIRWWSI